MTPLTITKRFEGSSYQTIADNFNDGKVVADPFEGGAPILGVLLSAGAWIFGGTRLISSRAPRAGSWEGVAGVTCRLGKAGFVGAGSDGFDGKPESSGTGAGC